MCLADYQQVLKLLSFIFHSLPKQSRTAFIIKYVCSFTYFTVSVTFCRFFLKPERIISVKCLNDYGDRNVVCKYIKSWQTFIRKSIRKWCETITNGVSKGDSKK